MGNRGSGNRTNHPKKQFCHNNHEIAICGRDKQGMCNFCIPEYRNNYYLTNRNEILLRESSYQKEHRKEINARWIERFKKDINFKLTILLRNRIKQAIKRNQKKGSSIKDLGCTIEFFKDYIETKFYSNMTWDNWGKVWQLDHIKELHDFDLTDPIQFKQAVHYTNMQPLTIPDHKKKTVKNRKILPN